MSLTYVGPVFLYSSATERSYVVELMLAFAVAVQAMAIFYLVRRIRRK